MKSLFVLFLAVLSVVAFSATPNIHRPRRSVSTPRKTEIVVPWKTVANEKPEVFADTLSVLTWPVRWAVLILFLLAYCWIWKIFIHKTTNSSKGFQK